jgi:hypothetical protein
VRTAWLSIVAATLAGCGGDDAPPATGAPPAAAAPVDDWAEGKSALEVIARNDAFAEHALKELPLEPAGRRTGWMRFLDGCRLFRLDAVFHKDHPRSGGAATLQRTFVLRRRDPRPYEVHDPADMLAFGRAQRIALASEEDVKDFADLALDASFAGSRVRRREDGAWEIVVLFSGRPGGERWRLTRDEALRPRSLEDLGYDAEAR